MSSTDDPSSAGGRARPLASSNDAVRTGRDGGGAVLRPNDPRRFLVETLIGAMTADGAVGADEQALLDRHLREHALFAGVAPQALRTIVEVASDAVRFAGSATARVPAIARGLPSRIHRLTAYALACEMVTADGALDHAETSFVETLRQALRIAPHEATEVYAALTAGHLPAHLDDRARRLRSLVPLAVELFTLRARALGLVTDDHRFALRDLFLAVPDLALPSDELDGLLFRAFRQPRPPTLDLLGELRGIASALPDPADRWWLAVYTLVVEGPGQATSWRVVPFAAHLQHGFGLADAEMDLAAADAATFPATLPRPR